MQIRLGDLKKAILEKHSNGESWTDIATTVGLNPETVMNLACNMNEHLENVWLKLDSPGAQSQ